MAILLNLVKSYLKFGFDLKTSLFQFFHTPIHMYLGTRLTWITIIVIRMLVSKQFLQVCQISKESEGVRGKMAKNLLI